MFVDRTICFELPPVELVLRSYIQYRSAPRQVFYGPGSDSDLSDRKKNTPPSLDLLVGREVKAAATVAMVRGCGRTAHSLEEAPRCAVVC